MLVFQTVYMAMTEFKKKKSSLKSAW